MGFLLLLKFAVKCFDILAWPLLSLGYPLCASIRAIEADSNSDIRKLVTYWVLFSLISLFDHAFAKLLEWLSFWPYVKLMVIFWLVVPHFDGSLYVYENLVRPCFSINPLVVIERCNKRKEKLFLERENFLVAAEIYLKENGPEALEKLISGKCMEPNVDEKEIKAVAATEKKEVEPLNCKEPNIAQKVIKSVEVTETKDEAAAKWFFEEPFTISPAFLSIKLKCKEPNVAQKEIKVVEITDKKELAAEKRVNQTVPILPQTQNQTFTASGSKEMVATTAATAGSDSKLPEIPASMKVQKEWACALCQVTTQSETTLLSHLQGQRHRAAYEELMAKNCAAKNKGSPASTAKKSDQPKAEAKKCESICGSNQKNTSCGSDQKNTGSSAKKSDQLNADAGKCVASNGPKQKNTGNGSNQKNSGSTDKKSDQPKADAKKCAASNESNQKNPGKRVEKEELLGKQKNPNKTGVGTQQLTLFCSICNVRSHSEIDMNSHLNGKRHFDRIQELNGYAGGDLGPNKTGVGTQQSTLFCSICNVRSHSEIDMNSHLSGKMHFDRIQELNGYAGGGLGPNKTGIGTQQLTLFCSICNVRSHSEIDMNSHLSGKMHFDRIQELNGYAGGGLGPIKTGVGTQQSTLFCSICNVRSHSEIDMNSHLIGKMHFDRIQELNGYAGGGLGPNKTGVGTKQLTLFCSICNVWSDSEINMNSHLSGKMHFDRIQELNGYTGGGLGPIKTGVGTQQSTLFCSICNVSSHSEIDMNSHLSGKMHFDRIQELNGYADGWN